MIKKLEGLALAFVLLMKTDWGGGGDERAVREQTCLPVLYKPI
jgi:hypothetical protein